MAVVHYKSKQSFAADHSTIGADYRSLSVLSSLQGQQYLGAYAARLFSAGFYSVGDIIDAGLDNINEVCPTTPENLRRLRDFFWQQYRVKLQ
jgi:hypothetical protein